MSGLLSKLDDAVYIAIGLVLKGLRKTLRIQTLHVAHILALFGTGCMLSLCTILALIATQDVVIVATMAAPTCILLELTLIRTETRCKSILWRAHLGYSYQEQYNTRKPLRIRLLTASTLLVTYDTYIQTGVPIFDNVTFLVCVVVLIAVTLEYLSVSDAG